MSGLGRLLEDRERKRQEAKKFREEALEKARLKAIATSTYEVSAGKGADYNTYKGRVDARTSMDEEHVKRRLLAEPDTAEARAISAGINEARRKEGQPGFWKNLWGDFIGAGETGAAVVYGAARPMMPYHMDSYAQTAEKVYKEKGIPTDGKGRRTDRKVAPWEFASVDFQSPWLENTLGKIPLPMSKDVDLTKEIYDRTDLPWGVKGALEIVFDPINLIPIAAPLKAAKGLGKIPGVKRGLGYTSAALRADPHQMVRNVRKLKDTKISGKRIEDLDYLNVPKSQNPTSVSKLLLDARKKALDSPQFKMVREFLKKQVGASRRTLEQIPHMVTESEYLKQLENSNTFIRRHFQKIEADGHAFKPYEWGMKAIIGGYKKINPTGVLSLARDNSSKALRAIGLSYHRDAMRDTNVAGVAKLFHVPKILKENESLYKEGGVYYDKLSDASKQTLNHKDGTFITANDLFGINRINGTMDRVDGAGGLNWMNLFEFAFEGVDKRGWHSVIKNRVYKGDYITRVGKEGKTQEFKFKVPWDHKNKTIARDSDDRLKEIVEDNPSTYKDFTVYLTKDQAQYIFQMQDVILDAANMMRSVGITDDVMKVHDDLLAESAKLFDRSKKVITENQWADRYLTKEQKLTKSKILEEEAEVLKQRATAEVERAYGQQLHGLEDVFAPGATELKGSRYIPRKVFGALDQIMEKQNPHKVGHIPTSSGERGYIGLGLEEGIERHGYLYINDPGQIVESFLQSSYKYAADFDLQATLSRLGMGMTKGGLADFDSDAYKLLIQGKETNIAKSEAILINLQKNQTILKSLRKQLITAKSPFKGVGFAIPKTKQGVDRLAKQAEEVAGSWTKPKGKAVSSTKPEVIKAPITGKVRDTIQNNINKFQENVNKIDAEDLVGRDRNIILEYQTLGGKLNKILGQDLINAADVIRRQTAGFNERVAAGSMTEKQAKEAIRRLSKKTDGYFNDAIDEVNARLLNINAQVQTAKKIKLIVQKGTYHERTLTQARKLKTLGKEGEPLGRLWEDYHVDESILKPLAKRLDIQLKNVPSQYDAKNSLGFISDFGVASTKGIAWISDRLRFLQTGFDAGFLFLQGLPLLTSNPKAWADTWKVTGKMFLLNDDKRAAYLSALFHTHQDTMRELAQLNVPMGKNTSDFFIALDNKYYKPTQEIGAAAVANNVWGAIPNVGRRAQAAFETSSDLMKIHMYDAWKHTAEKAGEKGLQDMAAMLRNISGSLSTDLLAVPKSQQRLERGFLFFSSRYTRASAAVLADVANGGIRGQMARDTVMKMGAGLTLGYTAFALGLNQEPKLDPRPKSMGGDGGDFMTLLIGDSRVGIGGFYMGMAKFASKFIAGDDGTPEQFKDESWQDDKFVRLWRSRTSPLTGTVWEQISGEDYLGYPFQSQGERVTALAKTLGPFWGQQIGESLEQIFTDDPRSKGLFGLPFELGGLQSRPADYDLRNDLREKYAMQEYPELWKSTPGASVNEKWNNLPRGIKTTLTEGFFDNDPEEVNNLKQLEERLSQNRQIRGNDVSKAVDRLFDDLDAINKTFNDAAEAAQAKLGTPHYDEELGMPLYVDPSYDFKAFREDIEHFQAAKTEAKRLLFAEVDVANTELLGDLTEEQKDRQLALEYLAFTRTEEYREGKNIEPTIDMAYFEWIDMVVKPPENANTKLKAKAQAAWEAKWGQNYWEAIQTMWAVKTHSTDKPYLNEWEKGRYDLFEFYFNDSAVDQIIEARPDAMVARELWDQYSMASDYEKKVIWENEEYDAEVAAIIKGIKKGRADVRLEFRKRYPELEAFLYRWGYIDAPDNFQSEELKAAPWAANNLRNTKYPIDPITIGYSQLYLSQ